jgi:hypothetical protein
MFQYGLMKVRMREIEQRTVRIAVMVTPDIKRRLMYRLAQRDHRATLSSTVYDLISESLEQLDRQAESEAALTLSDVD